MTHLVENTNEIFTSMLQFKSALENQEHEAHDYLTNALSSYRSWYAHTVKGKLIFAPSKVCGHKADELLSYCETKGRIYSGKETEDRLQNFFKEVTIKEDHDELLIQLKELLATYGKKPNAKTRFNLIKTNNNTDDFDKDKADENTVALLHACYNDLSKTAKSKFRRLIS
jgi:hypothetical protein